MSWIFFTLAAVIFQTFRNLEQKSLAKKIDAFTVSWSRFILPFPLAAIALLYSFHNVGSPFIFYCLISALMQIAGNIFLLETLKLRNFSIGIAFYKTEVLQTLILSLLFFDRHISASAVAAIILTASGVILISGSIFNEGIKKFFTSLNNKAVIYGLLCGFCFSISAFSLKFASQELFAAKYSGIMVPLLVLLWIIFMQNIFFIILKSYQKRLFHDLKTLFLLENKASFFKTSILSFSGSICWFTAFAFGTVVYVKAVGQLELLLAVLVSHFMLQEKIKTIEIAGIITTALGILWLILYIA